MRRLIGLVIIVVGALIGYNYFFGTAEEQENAREIVDEVRNLGRASWELLKSEKEKMEAGKYDEAAEKFKHIFEQLKGIATDENNREYLDRLSDLERRRQDLERKLDSLNRPANYEESPAPAEPGSTIERDLTDLYRATEELMREMEGQH